MLNTEHTFQTIVGTNITSKINLGYVRTFLELLNSKSKVERNYKRKLERLDDTLVATLKVTEFLLSHAKVKELSDQEASSIETVVFLCAGLDIENREKVINFIQELEN